MHTNNSVIIMNDVGDMNNAIQFITDKNHAVMVEQACGSLYSGPGHLIIRFYIGDSKPPISNVKSTISLDVVC